MDPPLTEEQRRLVDLVRELGRDRFAARAHRYDSEASFPFENYADLREAGLLGLTHPEAPRRPRRRLPTYARVSAELGRWCGATALTFNMHACTMLWSSQMADDLPMPGRATRAARAPPRAALRARRRDGAVFAQPFSEPDSAAAAGQAPFGTTARKVDGGWRVSGAKHFASLVGRRALLRGPVHRGSARRRAEREGHALLAVPADAPGARDLRRVGSRRHARRPSSRSLRFTDVFVGEDAMVMPRGLYARPRCAGPTCS